MHVSFVPERSRRYEIRQPLSKTNCMAIVVDAETMQPPPTFQAHEMRDSCRIRK